MLGDIIARNLPRLRAEALSRMTSTALIEAVNVAPDPATGLDVETATVVHASLACRVKASGARPRAATISAGTVTEVTDELHVPWDTAGLAEGLRVTITASDSPVVLGNRYRLAAPHEGDQTTAQRWGVETWPQEMTSAVSPPT